MSAIKKLKNFAIAITGNLFSSSKNNSRQKNKPLQATPEKKNFRQLRRQMSDFTIL
jgi:hypothetical protein